MKNKHHLLLPITVFAATLTSTSCNSDVNPPQSLTTQNIVAKVQTPVIAEPVYTFLKDCKDLVNNDNAAFSELSCSPVGDYQVKVTAQSPQFFNIHLNKGDLELSTDFTTISNDNPVEAGKAIEWHTYNGKPKYMIFRLSWGSEDAPFDMREYLVVNLITDKDICVLATVDVKNNKNANQKARDLISNEFKQTKSCPVKALTL